jgi:Asp/Glu/hydantoin racemase
MADADRVVAALDALIRQAVERDGAEAVVVGGGPLADAARALAASSPVPLVEAVPAAVRRMAALLAEGGRR